MQNEREQDKEYLDSLMCPSFNCYSTDQLAGIANQVVQHDHTRSTQNDDAFSASQYDDRDFEFTAFRDKGFSDDDAVFPLFNSDIVRHHRNRVSGGSVFRFPITGEHDPLPVLSSESSSEEDELEGVPAAMYCLWMPNSPGKCKKSNSTGSSSKKWKLLDLLRRSNSEGKESLLFLTPAMEKKKVNERWSIDVTRKPKGKGFSGEKKVAVAVSAHEALYLRNRELKKVDKKKSFLPYKPNLVGFCTSSLSKAFPSFERLC